MEISDIHYYFPNNALTNEDLSKVFIDWDNKAFLQKVGINKRFIVDDNETALDLGYIASKKLLKFNQS